MVPQHFAIHFVVPLYHVYNFSVKHGKFRDMWKESVVVTLSKCTCPKRASDLRPLSLTSIFAKVLENIIFFKTQSFGQSIIDKDQFADWPLCATTSAHTRLTHSWLQFLDEHMQGLIRIWWLNFQKRSIPLILPCLLVSFAVLVHPIGLLNFCLIISMGAPKESGLMDNYPPQA